MSRGIGPKHPDAEQKHEAPEFKNLRREQSSCHVVGDTEDQEGQNGQKRSHVDACARDAGAHRCVSHLPRVSPQGKYQEQG